MSENNAKVIAMSALLQSAMQVQSIARSNRYDLAATRCCLESLFKFQAESTREVYSDESGSLSGLQKGIRQMSLMGNSNNISQMDRECWRYVWLLLQLAAKLRKDDAKTRRLGQLLHSFNSQFLTFADEEEYYSQLAAIYQQVISHLQPKIMVYGEHGYLQEVNNAEKVRSLLLSGIRAGYLWWQLGGSRWQFILPSTRKYYAQQASSLLADMS